MTLPASGTYGELGSPARSDEEPNVLGAGLPAAWWPSIWGLASLAFSAFWIMESWRAAKPLLGPTKINHLTQDLWSLLVTLVCSFAIYQFWKPRLEALGTVLCIALSAIAMTWHRL